MKKKTRCTLKMALFISVAGLAGVVLAQEVPAMYRYYKMMRL